MKSQEPQEKKFRELSDEELKEVNGGMLPIILGAGIPEECKDPNISAATQRCANWLV